MCYNFSKSGWIIILRNVFLYVKKTEYEKCLKYGIKLSEYADIVVDLDTSEKKGIVAYLAPLDFESQNYDDFICLKINSENLKIYVVNKKLQHTKLFKKSIVTLENYTIGTYEEPLAIICNTILPENINIYNKLIDIPNLIQNSRDFYYEKNVYELIDTNTFSMQELYKALLILGEKKNIFEKVLDENNSKVYINKNNKKIYTDINKF